MKEIKGIIPAMVTPFDKNGAVNTDSIKKLVNVLIDENADGFYRHFRIVQREAAHIKTALLLL